MGYRVATVTAVNNVIGVAALLSSRNSRHRGLLPAFIVTGNEKKSPFLSLQQTERPETGKTLTRWRCPATTVWCLRADMTSATGQVTPLRRCARGRHARAPRAAGSRRAGSGSRLLRDRSRHEY